MPDKFSFDTVKDFDGHIDLSIPNYSFAAKQVAQFVEYFSEEGTIVYDLGCSTGKWLMSLKNKKNVKYIGMDISTNLLPSQESVSAAQLEKDIEFRVEDITKFNFCQPGNIPKPSVIVSLFTLQFLPVAARRKLIRDVSESLIPGGVFISCEKVYSSNGKFQDVINSMYYEFKNENFTGDEILSKEKDLRTMARLQTIEQSTKDMRIVGETELFWRSYNFVGLIAQKPYN